MIPNIIVSVRGLPKSGKNYFGYTFPDPIKVYCFNGGADFVRAKFKEKQIDVHNFVLPIVEDDVGDWALPVWQEFYTEYNKDVASGKYATCILDTGTEVENFCRQAVLEELQENKPNKQKLATNEYLARNLRMNALFARARNNGLNLVPLQYLKEQWVKKQGAENATPTGEMVLDGWNQTEAQADVNIEMSVKTKVVKGTSKTIMVATIKSNRFDRDLNGRTLEDTSYGELVALLLGEED